MYHDDCGSLPRPSPVTIRTPSKFPGGARHGSSRRQVTRSDRVGGDLFAKIAAALAIASSPAPRRAPPAADVRAPLHLSPHPHGHTTRSTCLVGLVWFGVHRDSRDALYPTRSIRFFFFYINAASSANPSPHVSLVSASPLPPLLLLNHHVFARRRRRRPPRWARRRWWAGRRRRWRWREGWPG